MVAGRAGPFLNDVTLEGVALVLLSQRVFELVQDVAIGRDVA